MTREHAKELLPIITEFANGETVQYKIRLNPDDKWDDNPSPSFNDDAFEYRIKPKLREFYLYKDNGKFEVLDHPPEFQWEEVVRVREILE